MQSSRAFRNFCPKTVGFRGFAVTVALMLTLLTLVIVQLKFVSFTFTPSSCKPHVLLQDIGKLGPQGDTVMQIKGSVRRAVDYVLADDEEFGLKETLDNLARLPAAQKDGIIVQVANERNLQAMLQWICFATTAGSTLSRTLFFSDDLSVVEEIRAFNADLKVFHIEVEPIEFWTTECGLSSPTVLNLVDSVLQEQTVLLRLTLLQSMLNKGLPITLLGENVLVSKESQLHLSTYSGRNNPDPESQQNCEGFMYVDMLGLDQLNTSDSNATVPIWLNRLIMSFHRHTPESLAWANTTIESIWTCVLGTDSEKCHDLQMHQSGAPYPFCTSELSASDHGNGKGCIHDSISGLTVCDSIHSVVGYRPSQQETEGGVAPWTLARERNRCDPGSHVVRASIVLLTMDRVESLKRLVKSIKSADYNFTGVTTTGNPQNFNPESLVLDLRLIIRVDTQESQWVNAKKKMQDVKDYVTQLQKEWSESQLETTEEERAAILPTVFTEFQADIAKENRGVVNAWAYANMAPRGWDEITVIIEDDMEVSNQYMRWIAVQWRYHWWNRAISEVALQRQWIRGTPPMKSKAIVNDHKPFLFRLLATWGFSARASQYQMWALQYAHKDWKRFLVKGTITENFLLTSKHPENNWETFWLYYTDSLPAYTLHVNLPDKLTLASNWMEKGLHHSGEKQRKKDFENVNKWLPENMGYLDSYLVRYGYDNEPES
eukprot:Clim_evm1s15 gene=Clim_evmTU1s15